MTPTGKQPAVMSDTPRTDAHRLRYNLGFGCMEPAQDGMWVTADFAEQLERELAEKDKMIRSLQSQVNLALDALDRNRK